MSIQQGLPGYVTSTAVASVPKSGFRSPVLVGRPADNISGGPLYRAAGIMAVQSTASLTNQIVSTADAVIGGRANFIYIPVTTGPLVGAAAPPYTGVGAPLVWDDANKRLAIWSSGSSSWMAQTSTVGGGYWTTS